MPSEDARSTHPQPLDMPLGRSMISEKTTLPARVPDVGVRVDDGEEDEDDELKGGAEEDVHRDHRTQGEPTKKEPPINNPSSDS